ncbi:HpcH/HpaI aldolase family protein [Niveispirillum sp. KHB5.9]|uniref:HpcH/HpaI aldolase family protein n=1 Tax=Niveispirillum sp. KHB5.9 TaxID=3400269 RepID=UPI003A894D60
MHEVLNPLKRRLADTSKLLTGTWLMSGAPSTAEAMGHCGFDFLVVDMEHVPIEMSDLANILRAIECTPAQAIVRLAWNDQVLVKRVMDAGARTVMLPFVETAEEARAAVSYTRYPPDGVRGVAAIHRGSRYGRVADYLKRANDEVAVIVQMETPGAVSRAAEIAAVPGVDALFLGPGDLSAAMGLIGQVGHAAVQDKIAEAARLAKQAGKPIGIVGPNPEMVGRFIDYGYSFAAVASDIAMMTGRAVEWQAALRGQAPAAPVVAGPY